MKTNKIIYKGIATICLVWMALGCGGGKPKSGEWFGNNISFIVNDSKNSITELEVMIPLGNDQYYSQVFTNLEINNNKFSYSFEGNSTEGIPEIDLDGEFVANNLAKGMFNTWFNVDWKSNFFVDHVWSLV